MPTTPAKKRIRRETIAAILGQDPAARPDLEARMLGRIRELPSYRAAGVVLLYVRAFPEEIDVGPLLADALAAGKRVACPRVDRGAWDLTLHEIRDPEVDLRPGTLGIPEPRPDAAPLDPGDIDWALAPGVAFDPTGNRVGRGAGHYDRLLPKLRPGVEVWALAFDRQVVATLPAEPHDFPITGIATPTRLIECGREGPRGQSASSHETAGGSA